MAGNSTGTPSGGYFSPYQNKQLKDSSDGEYLTDRLTNETIQFIKENKEAPFFAYLSFYTVHLPLQGKPEKVKKYQDKLERMNYEGEEFITNNQMRFKNRQNAPHYAAMVESLDENIGRILSALDEEGLSKNTIIVFTSDNGGMASGGAITPTTNAPLKAGKGWLYEGGIKEPMIVRWPKQVTAGTSCDEPVISTDFYPTLLDLAEIESIPNQHIDGHSLKPLLYGKELKERPIFWHYPHYSGGLGGRPSGAVRLGAYKLIEFYEDMHVELYNLENDIGENNDLSETLPEKANELKQLLHEWRKDINAQMPLPNPNYSKKL
ncbi:sulfatase [Aureibaculum sp. 2210JD6-5]|uniref:sulfatase n=1 Tax=Aureibaculum sp. 2210JD6-5 TaxID=3103957 RepID=UPI002AACA54A|nr:sulfatase [Aureibaculum sp. 2210JD6-5]MDY7396287.1 sulfatase [Aureibaculum sp. 2210JD6-5]